MAIKFNIKVGNVEVEYEGPEAFLNKKLPELIDHIAKIKGTDFGDGSVVATKSAGISEHKTSHAKITGTINTVASKLECSTGKDLLLAAAAQLTFVSGKATFSRRDLHEEMKKAKSYYKKTFFGNLTASLNRLLRSGQLVESATDTYALEASSANVLRERLR